MLQGLRRTIRRVVFAPGEDSPPARRYLDEVFAYFPFTDEAQRWLRATVHLEVQDLTSTSGGGFWFPGQDRVQLFTAQYEAAIHELAHAWWHYRRQGQEQALMDAVVRLAKEPDPRYQRVQRLAHDYVHGIPEQDWAGMLVEHNDWEMFAGLASGIMADVRLLPDYVSQFYDGLFAPMPERAASPAGLAPHA